MAFFSLVYAAQKIRSKKKATGNATQVPYSTLHFACGNSKAATAAGYLSTQLAPEQHYEGISHQRY